MNEIIYDLLGTNARLNAADGLDIEDDEPRTPTRPPSKRPKKSMLAESDDMSSGPHCRHIHTLSGSITPIPLIPLCKNNISPFNRLSTKGSGEEIFAAHTPPCSNKGKSKSTAPTSRNRSKAANGTRGKKMLVAKLAEDGVDNDDFNLTDVRVEAKPKRTYKKVKGKKKKDYSEEDDNSPSEEEEEVPKKSVRKKNNGASVANSGDQQLDSDPEMNHREPSAEDKMVSFFFLVCTQSVHSLLHGFGCSLHR